VYCGFQAQELSSNAAWKTQEWPADRFRACPLSADVPGAEGPAAGGGGGRIRLRFRIHERGDELIGCSDDPFSHHSTVPQFKRIAMLIVQSQSTDVYRNLALEEWLLDHAEGRGPVLFLCVNAPCVVIGKNQNPWRECRLSRMQQEGVLPARRISGGGGGVHDEGNLNAGVIVPRAEYHEDRQYEWILRTLRTFSIFAERLGKNALAVDGKKFSGQAFCFRRQHTLHHGTLLVNSDLDRLHRLLGAEVDGIETRAIASVPSAVMNLAEARPDLTTEALSGVLVETFKEMYGRREMPAHWTDEEVPDAELVPAVETLSSDEWIYGRTPAFTVEMEGQSLHVEKGRVMNRAGRPAFESVAGRTRRSCVPPSRHRTAKNIP
jgi:lipoate-protein ligase A